MTLQKWKKNNEILIKDNQNLLEERDILNKEKNRFIKWIRKITKRNKRTKWK